MCLLVIGLLTSCQNSPYPAYMQQRFQVVPVYQQAPAPRQAIVCGPSQRSSAEVNKALKKLNSQGKVGQSQRSKRMPKPQPRHFYVPAAKGKDFYAARWDKRVFTGFPDGVYWVVNQSGQLCKPALSPRQFWELYSECLANGWGIKMYDPYDPAVSPAR